MRSYLDLLDNILTRGRQRASPRHDAATIALFGEQLRFDLNDGFPLVTTRKVFIRGAIEELLWFLSGSTNSGDLTEKGIHIWDKWAASNDIEERFDLSDAARLALFQANRAPSPSEHDFRNMNPDLISDKTLDDYGIPRSTVHRLVRKGDCGPIYGKMWRSWPTPNGHTIDQIAELVNNLKTKTFSRRHVVSTWNPTYLPDERLSPVENVYQGRQSLAPCHTIFQFSVEPLSMFERDALFLKMQPATYVRVTNTQTRDTAMDMLGVPRNRLSCKLFARSQDVPVGTVFNLAAYAAFTLMLCQQCGFAPGDYIHSMGDSHIYLNQVDLVKEQLTRQPRQVPRLTLRAGVKSLFDYKWSDFSLHDYDPHPAINYPVTE